MKKNLLLFAVLFVLLISVVGCTPEKAENSTSGASSGSSQKETVAEYTSTEDKTVESQKESSQNQSEVSKKVVVSDKSNSI